MGFLNTFNIGGTDYAISDGGLYGTCATASGTAAKVVTCPDLDELVEGTTIRVLFSASNTAANPTLNVNGTGAVVIATGFANGALLRPGITSRDSWAPGSVVSFTYAELASNAYAWVMNDHIADTNTDTKVTQIPTSSGNDDYPILFKKSSAVTQVTDTVQFMSWVGARGFAINPSTGNVTAVSYNGHVLAAASEKGVDSSTTGISSSSTNNNVPTSLAVYNAIQDAISGAAGALVYHGTASSTSDMTDFSQGWYWIADASFTIGTGDTAKSVEPGDMLIANSAGTSATVSNIDVIQTNIDTLTNPEITTIWNNAVPVS